MDETWNKRSHQCLGKAKSRPNLNKDDRTNHLSLLYFSMIQSSKTIEQPLNTQKLIPQTDEGCRRL